jgi:TonB family protein
MIRRDHSLTVALCVSLVAHAGLVLVLVGRAIDGVTLKPAPVSTTAPHSPIFLAQSIPATTDLLFGDARGFGDAANSAPGDEPLLGRDAAQMQAFLSRDPVGAGHVGDEPSTSVLPQNVSRQQQSSDATPASVVSPPAAFGVQESILAPTPRVRRELPVAPSEPAPADAGGNTAPASPAPAADPAIMSDSESDPFARGNSIEFRDGRVDVRFGRKVKTVRPRLSLAARYDLLGMQYPRMIVRIHVERSGDVRKVDIVKSTGSQSADQEVKVALYQWWFEPPKNNAGVALADVVEFPIIWR